MRSVLVTGSSSGIGRATCVCLARDGWRVYAGVRSDADARSLEAEPGDIVAVRLELTDAASIAAARARIEDESNGALDALVNNAGIAIGGALELVPPEQLSHILDVNVCGQVAVSQAFLPLLRAAPRGRLLFVGSVGGRVAFPYAGPYHASKFALEAVADSLRAELRRQGVSVSLVEPGPIATPIWSKAKTQIASLRAGLDGEARSLYAEELRGFEQRLDSAAENGGQAQEVAEKILEALSVDSPAPRYPLGRGVQTLIALRSLLPDALFDRLAQRFIAAG
jgi:NAD(P)-dependent dehydrogenase (short-subunit alcohol dehydrogenase family)